MSYIIQKGFKLQYHIIIASFIFTLTFLTTDLVYSQTGSQFPTAVPTLPSNGSTIIAAPTLTVAVSDNSSTNLTVKFYGRLSETGSSFKIIGLPDTQNYSASLSGGSPAIFNSQTQWISDNAVSQKIIYVSHFGDIVEHGNILAEWDIANTAMSTLEKPLTGYPYGVPFGLAAGNHDMDLGEYMVPPATYNNYNNYFNASRFSGRPYYGGHYGNDNANHYDFFNSGGLEFIVIYLQFYPTSAHINWASSTMASYPNKRAILVSHSILNPDATFTSYGQTIYNGVKGNKNLFLMLCGHLNVSARRSDIGTNGNTIYSLLSDYQSQTKGGNGYLRIMEFVPSSNQINVTTYSPYTGQSLTDSGNKFTIPYNMTGSGSSTFTELTAVTVGNNSNASYVWNNLQNGKTYEWYASVTDQDGNTTTGPTWKFSTNFTVNPPTQSSVFLSSNPSIGGTTNGNGTYNSGSSVTVTATPANGYIFTNWTENGNIVSTSSSYTFIISGNRTLVANFAIISQTQYSVNLSSNPSVGGTTYGQGSGTYNSGSSVTVIATPAMGYTFTNWTENGNIVSTSSSYTFTISGNRTLVANFSSSSSVQYSVNLSSNPSIGGTTSGSGTYNSGSSVSVTATPATGYTFTGWSGDATSSTNPLVFTITSNKNLVANFSAQSILPIININPITLNFGNQNINSSSSPQSYTVSGNNLTAHLVITAQTGFTLSQTSNGTYTSTINLTPTSGTIPSTTIYVKFTPTTATSYNGNITNTSTGAVTKNVVVSGNGTDATGSDILLTNAVPITNISDIENGEIYYKIFVPIGQNKLEISTTAGIGDVDLYVKFGQRPTTSTYDYAPYLWQKPEIVTVDNPQSGYWYIMLKAFIDYSTVTLLATYSSNNTLTVVTSSNPQIGGSTSGGGSYSSGNSVTVTATANSGYSFVNWTEGSNVVSTSASYTFTINGSRTLVANFQQISSTNPSIKPTVTNATVPKGTDFWVEVKIGDPNIVSGLYGVSFKLSSNNANCVYVDDSAENIGFLGTGSSVIFFSKKVNNQMVDIGISKSSGSGVNGSGIVARAKFTSPTSITSNQTVIFSLSDITAINTTGGTVLLSPSNLTITINNVANNTVDVWPGDSNNDKTVNSADVIPIGLFYGQLGTSSKIGSLWQAYSREPWLSDGTTPKRIYADANGDGTINSADIIPIGLNYIKTHASIQDDTNKPEIKLLKTNSAATIKPVISSLVKNNTAFTVQVKIGDPDQVQNLYGISFKLQSDKSNCTYVDGSAENGGFLGTSSSVLFFPHQVNNQTVDFGITNFSGSGISGSGIIAQTKFISSIDQVVTFSLTDVTAVDNYGKALQLNIVPSSVTVDVHALNNLPSEFSLAQNYPNPFNPTTTIDFRIPVAGYYVVKVFNAIGQTVRIIAEKEFSVGNYSVTFDGNDLTSGLYFYQLLGNQANLIRKMMLIK